MEYQWAEACEWLFEATKDARYRDMALKLAKVNQRTMPFDAWAYAMEVRLTSNKADRKRALGFALYLDPASERLAAIPEKEKAEARAWFAKNNPFKAPAPGGKGRQRTAAAM
jgi:hypothetical protein